MLSVAHPHLERLGFSDIREYDSPELAVQRAAKRHTGNIERLREAAQMLQAGKSPEEVEVTACQEFLGVCLPEGAQTNIDSAAPYGYCRCGPGYYVTQVTQPEIFARYYTEQLALLQRSYDVGPEKLRILTGTTPVRIPLAFALEGTDLVLDEEHRRHFASPDLRLIRSSNRASEGIFPLGVFSALQTDFAGSRFLHYTHTSPKSLHNAVVLLTNYDWYVESWIKHARRLVSAEDSGYVEFIQPEGWDSRGSGNKRPQMPAFHLKRRDGYVISLINVGVGPSNTANMLQHVAAYRPHALMFVGHCAGLRETQQNGTFILGEGYYRKDGIMDRHVPPTVPIPPIAEINNALKDAAVEVCGFHNGEHRRWLERGTIATVADRNWEVDEGLSDEIIASKALAVDMESATLAASGFHWMVPYGTLLVVSDRPLHNEPKLRGTARRFYNDIVDKHLLVALRAAELLIERGPENLHSRKLRGPNAPAFR